MYHHDHTDKATWPTRYGLVQWEAMTIQTIKYMAITVYSYSNHPYPTSGAIFNKMNITQDGLLQMLRSKI